LKARHLRAGSSLPLVHSLGFWPVGVTGSDEADPAVVAASLPDGFRVGRARRERS
jgi:hypothetical protein